MRVINALALATLLLTTAGGATMAEDKPAAAVPSVAVGAQYDTAHVYVASADLDRFSAVSSQRSAAPSPNKLP